MKRTTILLVLCILLSSCKTNTPIKEDPSINNDINEQEYIIDDNEPEKDGSQVDDYNDEFGVGINSNNFPDKALRQYILNYYDADQNHYLSKEEIENSKVFNYELKHVDSYGLIECLSGFATFNNLEELFTANINNLLNNDFSVFSKLKLLDLWECYYTEIDFSNNKFLENLIIEDPMTGILSLRGISSKISINIIKWSKKYNNELILDISDCDYFNLRKNIFESIDFDYYYGENVMPTKVIKDDEIVMYDSGIRNDEYIEVNKDGIDYRFCTHFYYLGNGTSNIVDDTIFDNLDDALEYGTSGNSWFRIEDIHYDDITQLGYAVRLTEQPY